MSEKPIKIAESLHKHGCIAATWDDEQVGTTDAPELLCAQVLHPHDYTGMLHVAGVPQVLPYLYVALG